MNMLQIDGSQGEGGGQILRTALSLSMCKQRPVAIVNIRAGRKKPGLMRQHLVCVEAARALCGAQVTGAELGSQCLEFIPAPIKAGSFRFDIGSAGSTTLVLQTLLPALLSAERAGEVEVTGGTHNPLAPSADFLQQRFLPQLQRLGANIRLETLALGLAPAGRGQLRLQTQPWQPQQRISTLDLSARSGYPRVHAKAIVARVPTHVAERELLAIRKRLSAFHPNIPLGSAVSEEALHTGPGNVLELSLHFDNVCEHITVMGERGLSAESVADAALKQMFAFLRSAAVVGEHLADQLLLPMWLSHGGQFVTACPSEHLRTNAAVIEAFGGANVRIEAITKDMYRVAVERTDR